MLAWFGVRLSPVLAERRRKAFPRERLFMAGLSPPVKLVICHWNGWLLGFMAGYAQLVSLSIPEVCPIVILVVFRTQSRGSLINPATR